MSREQSCFLICWYFCLSWCNLLDYLETFHILKIWAKRLQVNKPEWLIKLNCVSVGLFSTSQTSECVGVSPCWWSFPAPAPQRTAPPSARRRRSGGRRRSDPSWRPDTSEWPTSDSAPGSTDGRPWTDRNISLLQSLCEFVQSHEI